MEIIFLAILGCILGAVIYTIIGYVAKYLKTPETPFSIIYLFTSMLSLFLVILLSPVLLLPGILPFAVSGLSGQLFILVGCVGIGFMANYLLNLPVSFILKQLATENISVTNGLKKTPKYLIYALCLIGLFALIGGASVNALAQYEASVHTTGTIEGVNCELYQDAGLTVPISEIEWGIREPGSSISVSIWVKNTGNVPVSLYYYTSNWNPPTAQTYMDLTWDYVQDAEVSVGAAMRVTFTLSVDSEITGITNFEFDITVVASG